MVQQRLRCHTAGHVPACMPARAQCRLGRLEHLGVGGHPGIPLACDGFVGGLDDAAQAHGGFDEFAHMG